MPGLNAKAFHAIHITLLSLCLTSSIATWIDGTFYFMSDVSRMICLICGVILTVLSIYYIIVNETRVGRNNSLAASILPETLMFGALCAPFIAGSIKVLVIPRETLYRGCDGTCIADYVGAAFGLINVLLILLLLLHLTIFALRVRHDPISSSAWKDNTRSHAHRQAYGEAGRFGNLETGSVAELNPRGMK